MPHKRKKKHTHTQTNTKRRQCSNVHPLLLCMICIIGDDTKDSRRCANIDTITKRLKTKAIEGFYEKLALWCLMIYFTSP